MSRFRRLLPFAGFAIVLGFWALITSPWFSSRAIITAFSPWETAPAFVKLVQDPRTWEHTFATLRRIGIGLSIAFGLGVPFGVLMGSFRTFERTMSASTQFLRMISPLAWMPVAVMILGIGEKPILFLIAIASIWSIALNTAAGIATRDPRWVEMSTSLGATGWETLWHVTIPAIRGHVLTGLRISLGIAWLVLVPAEMLGVREGVGYAILDARDRLAYPEIMGLILWIGVLGWTLDTSLRLAESRWSASKQPASEKAGSRRWAGRLVARVRGQQRNAVPTP